MSLEVTKQELLKQAIYLKKLYETTRVQDYKDQETRIRKIIVDLDAFTISSGSQTLQEVTDSGNTTTNPINVGGITTPYVQLDTAATPTLQPGMFGWNDAYGTADLRLKGNNVTLQVGQETLARVVNKTGADLLESQYKAVRIRLASEGGAVGQRLAVVLAKGDADLDSVTTLGIVTETIANNQEGFVTVFGNINEINTTGSLQGETWVDGDVLYLSPTTAGSLTKVKPTAPNHTVTMGYVVYAHAVHGKIFVKVDNGYELEELHDVLPTPYINNGVLYRDTTANLWKSATIATLLGGTPLLTVPTLAQVTTAGNVTTNAITVGGLTVNTNLLYTDTINGRVGIGTTSPTRTLTVNGPIVIPNNSAYYTKATSGSELAVFLADTSNNVQIGSVFFGGGQINYTSTYFDWYNYPSSVLTHRMRLTSSGNLLIGTTTDAGYKLDVNGTTRTTGLIVNTDLIYTDLTSNAVIIGATSLTNAFNKFEVRDTGTSGVTGRLQFRNDNNDYTYLTVTSNNVGFNLGAHSNGAGYISVNQALNLTSNHINNNATLWLGNGSRLSLNNSAATARYLTVSTAGNLIVGGSTDAGYRLDVNGTARVVSAAYFQNEINGLWGVGELTFNRGSSFNTPTLGVGNTDVSGKFAALIAGTAGAGFIFDSSGFFTIGNDTKANYNNRILGGATVANIRVWGSTGNVVINSTTDAGYKLHVVGDINTSNVFRVGGVGGWTGTINIPTNPPGQQNIQVVGGIIVNVS